MLAKLRSEHSSIKEGSWKDFRNQIKAVNTELFNIIEQISPDEKYKLYEITYLYGEKITDVGTICIPDNKGHVLRLDNPQLPTSYREQLGYCPTPLILQLNKGGEVFIETSERIIPLNVFTPGDLYGLFEILVPLTGCPFVPCWSVTSGARSVFLGAKVSETIGHKRLRTEYGVDTNPPKNIIDQWNIIKTIGNRSNIENPWTSKVIVFGKDWFQEQPDNKGWLLFHNYLFKKSWLQSKNIRIKTELSIFWEAFATAVRNRNLKPNSYILDSIMHNVFLANGLAPGFIPADTSELLLPSKSIEYAYENVYGLKDYAAMVMHPWRLGVMNKINSVYYSLVYPTLQGGTPAIRKPPSIISELRDIKMLMTTFEKILEQQGKLAYEFIKNAGFEYFHTEEDKFKEIIQSKYIMEQDPYLIACNARFNGKPFPFQGSFFRGCIKITSKVQV